MATDLVRQSASYPPKQSGIRHLLGDERRSEGQMETQLRYHKLQLLMVIGLTWNLLVPVRRVARPYNSFQIELTQMPIFSNSAHEANLLGRQGKEFRLIDQPWE